jgi:hypothetical protein
MISKSIISGLKKIESIRDQGKLSAELREKMN